jgi:NitT/TauT family transport system ATP-binding protein
MPGERLVVMGSSGSGKTTLLLLIGGLTRPDSGEIFAHGKAVLEPNPDAVTVFQNTASTLLPWRSALANIRLPLEAGAWRNPDRRERERIAGEVLKSVGLGPRASARPRELSGGMQQRVALGRALVTNASVLLMDEPFTSLNPRARHAMQKLLLEVVQQRKLTVVLATHDVEEAMAVGTVVVVLGEPPIHSIRVCTGATPEELKRDVLKRMLRLGV